MVADLIVLFQLIEFGQIQSVRENKAILIEKEVWICSGSVAPSPSCLWDGN